MALTAKKILIPILFLGIIFSQYFYDAEKSKAPSANITPSLPFVKSTDLGLNSALASFFWIDTRAELPFFREGYQKFFGDLNLVNNLDPKFAAPYVYTLIVLPYTEYPDRIGASLGIGGRGVSLADPDWQIPFWLGTIYHLFIKDPTSAAKYFDLAARTPGIPEIVKRFAVNYGVLPKLRDETQAVWRAIYESSDDKDTKARAAAYLKHFEILDYLQTASDNYKKIYGRYPARISDLLEKKIITEIPPDPFGLEFAIYEGGIVGIKQLPQE